MYETLVLLQAFQGRERRGIVSCSLSLGLLLPLAYVSLMRLIVISSTLLPWIVFGANSTPIGILNLGCSEERNISSANTSIVEQLNSVAAQ